LAGHSLSISASIGIALYPEHGVDESTLTKHADIAMYYAKAAGRNGARLFEPEGMCEISRPENEGR
jgi:GGDEF domain-containing protein